MTRESRFELVKGGQVADPQADGQFSTRYVLRQEFARRLRKHMLDRRMTQADLVRASGLTKDSVSKYVNAKAFPTSVSLAAIAEVFGVTVDQLAANHAMTEVDRDELPAIEIKASQNDPAKSWLRINRLVRTQTALKVFTLLQDDDDAPDRE